jgi:hypothetical protein
MWKALGLNVGVVILGCFFCTADTLLLRDGSTHSGTFVSATIGTISFREGTTVHRYARSKIQSIEFGSTTAGSPAAEAGTTHPASNSRASVVARRD